MHTTEQSKRSQRTPMDWTEYDARTIDPDAGSGAALALRLGTLAELSVPTLGAAKLSPSMADYLGI